VILSRRCFGCGGALLIGLAILSGGLAADLFSYTAHKPVKVRSGASKASTATRKQEMIQLHVALQVGFSNDTVKIEIDSKEVYSKTGVTTPRDVGRADSFDVKLSEGTHDVFVAIPTRRSSETIRINLVSPIFLGILLSPDGKITHQISSRPFAYM
jgi:hypothetical protein